MNRKLINVAFSNVDVLTQEKFQELRIRINNTENKPDLIALIEVKAKQLRFNRELYEFKLEGYSILEKNLGKDSTGRGLMIYVKNGIEYQEIKLETEFSEYISLKIINKQTNLFLTSVYRSPNSSKENNDKLMKLLSEIYRVSSTYKIIFGDFNFPNIDWNNYTCNNDTGYKFIEKIKDGYLISHVTEPTRFRSSDRASLIDLLTNDETNIENVEVHSPLGKSDHSYICFKCNFNIEQKKVKKEFFLYDKANYEQMRYDLDKNWSEKLIFNEVEENWKIFYNSLKDSIEKYVPKISKVVEGKKYNKNGIHYDKRIVKKVKKKQRLWERIKKMNMDLIRYSKDHINEIILNYKRLNNQIRMETRKIRKNIEINIAKKSKDNQKLFWKYVKSNTTIKSAIPPLVINSK